MRRRRFIAALGTVLVPGHVFSQAQRVWRVGALNYVGTRPASLEKHSYWGPFLEAMRGFGYIEGRNVEYDWRFAEGSVERLEALASQLVKSDVIVAPTTAAVLAAKRATQTVPIVFVSVADPVGSGAVSSLARPAGNATGLSMLQIQDGEGRIISSGHFRNEHGRLDPGLAAAVAAARGPALVLTSSVERPFLALVRTDSFTIAGRPFTIVGGVVVDEGFLDRLARDPAIVVSLAYSGGQLSTAHKQRAAHATACHRPPRTRN